MGETRVIEMGKGITHRMISLGTAIDALTGEEWERFECPTCGYLQKMQFEPYKSETLRLGEGMLTEQDTLEFAELCKTPAGRMKVSRILARQPGHTYLRVPTEDELREMAATAGKLEEFEASVDQAIIDGEPLLSLKMGGHTASTWPRGTGPK